MNYPPVVASKNYLQPLAVSKSQAKTFINICHRFKLCTHVANNLLAIDLEFDVHMACNGLQQKFQHAEYFTCDPLIYQPKLPDI